MRIVIAEDSAVIRAGLTEILTHRGHEIVAAVGDAEALKVAVAADKPDVAIIDVLEPLGTGTRVSYDADLRLRGLLRIADPLLALVFRRVGDRARMAWRAHSPARPLNCMPPPHECSSPCHRRHRFHRRAPCPPSSR